MGDSRNTLVIFSNARRGVVIGALGGIFVVALGAFPRVWVCYRRAYGIVALA